MVGDGDGDGGCSFAVQCYTVTLELTVKRCKEPRINAWLDLAEFHIIVCLELNSL